ncbi:DUF86 domain-containing protein [Candidatus Poribacteria bacterium]
MPRRDWRLCIEDILESIVKIQRYTEGIAFETFAADEMRIDAVVRNITIIGEASGAISAEIQERYPQIPWGDMKAMRNVVVHKYFGISLSILWETVEQDLSPLIAMLKDILESYE